MKLPPKNKIEEIAKEFKLKLILLFGSQVDKKTHRESDVDLAFLPEEDLSFEQEILLNTQFCNIFRTDRADTVNLKKAPPLLLQQIADNSKILYEKQKGLYDQFLIRAQKRYFDEYLYYIAPLVEERIKNFVKDVK